MWPASCLFVLNRIELKRAILYGLIGLENIRVRVQVCEHPPPTGDQSAVSNDSVINL